MNKTKMYSSPKKYLIAALMTIDFKMTSHKKKHFYATC